MISPPSPGLYTRSDGHFSSRDIGTILTRDDLSVGIDKMKVFWVPGQYNPSDGLWLKGSKDLADGAIRGNAPLDVGHGTAVLNFSSGLPHIASVEFNPCAVLSAQRELVSLSDAFGALARVLVAAREFVEVPRTASHFALSRLDLTVDFDPVSDMERLLGLAEQARPYRTARSFTAKSPLDGVVESVTFPTRSSGSVLFYNKSAERQEDGRRFRIEVKLERSNLTRLGQSELSSLSDDVLRAAVQKRLETFINLCLSDRSTRAGQILQSREFAKTLISAAGYAYLRKYGHFPVTTKHWGKRYAAFKKRFPHHSIEDLL